MAEAAVLQAEARRSDDTARAELEAGVLDAKGWDALGAFDPDERSRALDLLGFDRQLVFPTFASSQFLGLEDRDVRAAGNRALNRGIVDFCSHDERLMAVAFVPLGDPERAAAEVEASLNDGAAAIQVSHDAPKRHSHTHPAYDGVWARLAEAGVPFVLHVGGARLTVPRSLHDNGLAPVTDFLGGGENIRSKDFLCINHSPSLFLGTLILDGVFDRHPHLRGGVIEEGAGWVVSWMHQLDYAQRAFRRTEEPLRTLADRPSDYVHRHLKFTPFAGEPVGWMIEQAGDDMFLFSSDYPHPEGTKDPIGKFEDTLEGVGDDAKERFYSRNFAELFALT
jgi:predicted TIM-barrel fold metal-dependent hydrolase